MAKYIKKPVAIVAVEWTKENLSEIADFVGSGNCSVDELGELYIYTLEGSMEAQQGDMIIKGVKGECYPCKPDVFKLTYYTEREYAESNL